MATKKKTNKKVGAPTKYTRDIILRFIGFMVKQTRCSVLFQHENYNGVKSAKQRQGVSFKHVPLLNAMRRESLRMTDIFTEAGKLKEEVAKEIRKLPRLR